ncbi:MAG: hypothetical protein IMZ66_11160 [Planctomycetes bacterium]|nr:hypothetical protein [Planctomycetota bacterium]
MSMRKSVWLLIPLAAAVFGASYGLSLWLGAALAPAVAEEGAAAPDAGAAGSAALPSPAPEAVPLEEKYLTTLIGEVRAKLQDLDQREIAMREEEHRVRVAHQDLQKEAQQLETLRTELAASLAKAKQADAEFLKNRITIQTEEVANLKRTAAIYDKMDAEAASKTLESMCQNNQGDDAAKILVYMTERTAAKLLDAVSDKTIVAALCERMKTIREKS